MWLQIKQRERSESTKDSGSCESGSRSRNRQDGYVMLLIVALLAGLSVALYKIIPQYAFEAQRDKEEELIFRGESYRKAIQGYVRKFGRYPSSLEELQDTNNIKFIRKLYKDPMTEDGEWRLIHIGPGGTFPDSKVSGSGTNGGNLGSLPVSNLGEKNQTQNQGQNPGQSDNPPEGIENQTGSGRNPPNRSTGPTFGGGAIAGVASMSEQESIRIFQEQTTYDKWEFIFDYRRDPIAMQGPLGQQQGAASGNPSRPGPGTPGTPNSTGNPNTPGNFPGFRNLPGFGRNPNTGGQPIGIPPPPQQPGVQPRF